MKVLMIAVCISGATVNNVMAENNSKTVNIEQQHPRSMSMRTTQVSIGHTTTRERNQIKSQLMRTPGIKRVSFQMNTVTVTYSTRVMSSDEVRKIVKRTYRNVVNVDGKYNGNYNHQGNNSHHNNYNHVDNHDNHNNHYNNYGDNHNNGHGGNHYNNQPKTGRY